MKVFHASLFASLFLLGACGGDEDAPLEDAAEEVEEAGDEMEEAADEAADAAEEATEDEGDPYL